MARTLLRVEQRLLDVVLLTLAAGCSANPQPATPTGLAAGSATAAGQADQGGQPGDGQSSKDTLVVADQQPPPDPEQAAQAEQAKRSAELCADYKARSQIDGKGARVHQTEGYGPAPRDQASWDQTTNQIQCVIVREVTQSKIEVTRTPTCCPSGPRNQPCPPAYKTMAAATSTLLEHATLHSDGKFAKNTVQKIVAEKNPEPRHNCGRSTAGTHFAEDGHRSSASGAILASMAELEAASVPAFERLALELQAHGAPRQLSCRARSSARDERRHATQMARLAQRKGAKPRSLQRAELSCRPLFELALENMVEGCVKETFGALTATYQGERACPALRPVFRRIAADERQHAALAHDVQTWLDSRLSAAQRTHLHAARALALGTLRGSLASSETCEELGLPAPNTALQLFDAYFGVAAS